MQKRIWSKLGGTNAGFFSNVMRMRVPDAYIHKIRLISLTEKNSMFLIYLGHNAETFLWTIKFYVSFLLFCSLTFVFKFFRLLKFRYSVKVTKFEKKSSSLFWLYFVEISKHGRFFSHCCDLLRISELYLLEVFRE